MGVGTGRFALPPGITVGVEPALAMTSIARKRGIEVYEARAEELPFDNESFDFVVMVTTICFLRDPNTRASGSEESSCTKRAHHNRDDRQGQSSRRGL